MTREWIQQGNMFQRSPDTMSLSPQGANSKILTLPRQSNKPSLIKLSSKNHSSSLSTKPTIPQQKNTQKSSTALSSNTLNAAPSVLKNYLPSSLLLKSQAARNAIDASNTGEASAPKVIVRFKRKRSDELQLEEFYLPEKKRKRIDAVLEKLGEFRLEDSDAALRATSPSDVERPGTTEQGSTERHSIDSSTPIDTINTSNTTTASQRREPFFDVPSDSRPVFQPTSSLLSKDDGPISFAKFKLLERGGSIKQISQTSVAGLKRKKHDDMTQQQKSRRLIKLQEKRENNVKIIDFAFENESSPDSNDMSDDDVVYDIFVKEPEVYNKPPLSAPVLESFIYDDEDDLENEDIYSREYDSDDSNAENNTNNDYGYLSDTDDYAAYTLPGEELATLSGSTSKLKERPDYEEEEDDPYEVDSEGSDEEIFARSSVPFRKHRSRDTDEEETDEDELMDFLDKLEEDESNGMEF